MELSTVFARLRKVARLARQLKHNLRNTLNDAFYWDEYVKDWEKSGSDNQFKYLGSEWKNEDIFVSLLAKYSSRMKSALEIGCGGGRITARAVELFQRVYAADVSREMLRKCKESIDVPTISFHKLDGFTLSDFQDASIDLVYSHDTFCLFSSLQVFAYFKEIRRVLKTGGIGLISFYNTIVHFNLFKEMSLKLWERRRLPPHMRIHFTTEEILRRMLSDLECEVLEVQKENYLIVVFQKQAV